ncbi:hypothetical protein PMI07_002354 [Rhizobium sp. CF080]|nr:hypothetical protein PMI07_002354 [Rhizobium sp. CF080]
MRFEDAGIQCLKRWMSYIDPQQLRSLSVNLKLNAANCCTVFG